MRPALITPQSLPDALDALERHGYDAKIIAGGTAVVLMLQQRLIDPKVLINLGDVPGMDYIRLVDDGLHIGALALLRDIEQSSVVRDRYPALADACGAVGNVRIRNQATLGGNLAEADYASDPPAVLVALDASLSARSTAGSRSIPLSDFFRGFYATALEPSEVVTDIFVPALPGDTRMTYLKFKSRSSEDRPCVGVAAVATFDGEACDYVRVAVGAACEVPQRLSAFEALAQGERLSDALISEIAEGYASNIETLEDLRGSAWYRKEIVRVQVRRALEEVRDGRW